MNREEEPEQGENPGGMETGVTRHAVVLLAPEAKSKAQTE